MLQIPECIPAIVVMSSPFENLIPASSGKRSMPLAIPSHVVSNDDPAIMYRRYKTCFRRH
jgi:hypothetical protein